MSERYREVYSRYCNIIELDCGRDSSWNPRIVNTIVVYREYDPTIGQFRPLVIPQTQLFDPFAEVGFHSHQVNTGSIADKAGLQAGDAVVRINQTDLYNLRHKEAQDAIVKAGPSFEFVVQRGGATWKPTITPLSSAAASPIPGNYTPVTKTSLAANKQPVSAIGTGHNTAARPFVPPSPVRSIVNKQYNSPVAMYSEETIAETLTSQAEVLAGGCLGVNFKKNEKVYNPEKSEVLKALQENDNEPEPAESSTIPPYHPPPQQTHQNIVTKHVTAPVAAPSSNPSLPPGQNICADCELGSTFYWRQSHAIGGSATSAASPRPLTPSYQITPDTRIGTALEENQLAPGASHRPSLPVQPTAQKPASIPAKPKISPLAKPTPNIVPPQISVE
ncbi:hypothetical protein PVAND_000967 [Polypedilum vanderplanki]|uniref:PDZ domain-containing protein n=1 Tax=Polypedilum vanderplanki TaxID=319348 RepID=A0A9J6BMQ1_POLVA|nr:hypothetical protein PVAND_000967 [Polypedilum vanderplanki]